MIKKISQIGIMVLLGTGLFLGQAHATVDALLDYTIVYEEPQSGDFCYKKMPMWAMIGIPPASLMNGTFSPTQIIHETGNGINYLNINEIATAPAMTAKYVNDAVNENVYEYEMTIDVTNLARANGHTIPGRRNTIRAAKLALLAMAKNMHSLSHGMYRLRVTFIGLPNQAMLPGIALNATTQCPYSAGSSLLAAYEKELMNLEGSCR